jgi:hypothetical protein
LERHRPLSFPFLSLSLSLSHLAMGALVCSGWGLHILFLFLQWS